MWYALLGRIVWKGGRYAVRVRYGDAAPSRRTVALAALGALTACAALAAVMKRPS